jgi:hypothetical protein
MISDRNISEKSLALALHVMALAGIALAAPLNDNGVAAQQQLQQQQTTETSIQHNAKGHESHQVVNLQNATEGVVYAGSVTFNSSKPVDIIAYDDITGQQQPTNATVKVWEVDGKKYATKTLMKNATEGTVDFQGAGIVTHSTSSDPYKVTFSINASPINKGQ